MNKPFSFFVGMWDQKGYPLRDGEIIQVAVTKDRRFDSSFEVVDAAAYEDLMKHTLYLENQVVELNKQNHGFRNQLFQAMNRPIDAYDELRDENEKLKRIIAKELTENDELGCEFVYVNVLKRANADLLEALKAITLIVAKDPSAEELEAVLLCEKAIAKHGGKP